MSGIFIEVIRGIRNKMLEVGLRMYRWVGEIWDWFFGCVMKEELDDVRISLELGFYLTLFKMKFGCVFFFFWWYGGFIDLRVEIELFFCDYFIGCKVYEIMVIIWDCIAFEKIGGIVKFKECFMFYR